MKIRKGFTLIELIISVFIFGYMAASLSTIYATSHRHMFQNYRGNVIKTGVLVGMRAIQNNLTVATKLDSPGPGAQGNVLAFATNVDQNTRCYPVNAAVAAAWHYFCQGSDPLTPGFNSLYYHTAPIPGGTPCGNPAPSIWSGVYPVPTCGANIGGQTVLKLMQYSSPTTGSMFSRRTADGVNDTGTVRIRLRAFWPATTSGLGGAQRDIDFSLDTVIRVNRSL